MNIKTKKILASMQIYLLAMATVGCSNEEKSPTVIETSYENESTTSNVGETNASETELTNYLEEFTTNVGSLVDSSNIKEIPGKIVDATAAFILFLTDNGTIKGYTFSELSDEAKLKVETLFVSMDSKIESKFPNYKEAVSEKSDAAKEYISSKYTDVKGKVKDYIVSKVGEDKYNDTMDSISDGYTSLKGNLSDSLEKAKDKITDWAKKKTKE